MKQLLLFITIFLPVVGLAKIDRQQVLTRNNPHVNAIDSLASLSVGNGHFAFTVDATGLQTFPEAYRNGIPLGTMSDWGWHSFPNKQQLTTQETLRLYDFGRGRQEPYAVQIKEDGRKKDAANYYRVNPHRLHLGTIGFDLPQGAAADIQDIDQTLELWDGLVKSRFAYRGVSYEVETACLPDADAVVAKVKAAKQLPLVFRFPYPTGVHSDDGCRWDADPLHTTTIVGRGRQSVLLRRVIDATTYYVRISWQGKAKFQQQGAHRFTLTPRGKELRLLCEYIPSDKLQVTSEKYDYSQGNGASSKGNGTKVKGNLTSHLSLLTSHLSPLTSNLVTDSWHRYWNEGGIIDFSKCTDPRAKELERRIVLSQYLMAIQDAGDTPPQETGLTYNSWFGKFHLEMILWHQAQFALWGHPELLDRSLSWYFKVADKARDIARRQGFKGLRWMKMTDPSGIEAPSSVGSFLIWQQPHLIYLAELMRRAESRIGQTNKDGGARKYQSLIDETAEFMADFAEYDARNDRYVLRGCIAAQETLPAATTINPPFELSYWHCALQIAQQWREREGKQRVPLWDDIIGKIAPLAQKDSLYLAAESEPDTYKTLRMYSDHPAVLGAVGILPLNKAQVDTGVMHNTLQWVWNNWNWDKTWGWDFPMTAMCAARLGDRQKAVDALLLPLRTNTYLINGHNYQDQRLRLYLPGNGGLLMAAAMMCAGWDGSEGRNPGFPQDGTWNVEWEGLFPMP